jgi:hypothetical protein
MHRNVVLILAVFSTVAVACCVQPVLMQLAPLVVIGLIPAGVACWKGYGDRFGTWWMYGSVLWAVAMIHVTVLPWRHR